MKPHAKTALSLALAIVGGIAAGLRCDASEWVDNSSQTNPRPAAYTVKEVVVQVRQTPAGPRIFVDGKAVRPRFFYGSPPCLSPISMMQKHELIVPFRADEDTDCGCVRVDGFDGDEPMWFSNPFLVDATDDATNSLVCAGEERTSHFMRGGLAFTKGHLYRFHVTHRAVRPRTYFTHEVSYIAADGGKRILPLPYGDTLCDTARMASEAGVDFITLSPDTSWGWEDWWAPEGEETDYGKLDRLCEAVIAANPKALLVPRVNANAPAWMLERDPSIKMKFDKGYTIEMSSVSARPYRRAACEAVEKLARHLRAKFPKNFAGLQITGQNSAEWFYMLSQSDQLSGYDSHTRDAFRRWLAAHGEKDADVADVPTGEERRAVRPGSRWDPVKDRRVVLFGQFRQEEMASFICELGAAVKKGTDGKSLACFFYGYTWELGGVLAGAAETGHFFVDWLTRNGRGVVDVLSGPVSYSDRAWPGSTPVMSAAETIMRRGILWFDEDDLRTHLEDLWTWPIMVGGWRNDSPWRTRNMLLRNSAVHILKGYGDWWMDLCGRGWFRDSGIWDVRRALNAVDDAMLARERPYSPEIAVVMDEESMMMNGWGSSAKMWTFCNRMGFETCGAPYGQYLLDDVLENPPAAKLFYVAYAKDLSPERREKLDALRKRQGATVFVADSAADMTAEAIARRARAAGVHLYAEPGKAVVCASEGYVVVQSRREGPLELDFGDACTVSDALTGASIGSGPAISVPFKEGETRVFKAGHVE